ncbi:uncharacterized protein LOC119725177 [Patiria miniata]|uniref:G-protein coupled receptors family 2 profile 2 domain-containing protein n=1 Tax=Patiria miniata TaxID=46514 RepID=A0A913ZN39_PATMI|nr:uncharacterized protein LOC119725177 [Patiria miniata]
MAQSPAEFKLVVLVFVCVCLQLLRDDVTAQETEGDCEIWIDPPVGIPEAYPIGLGQKVTCGINDTLPTSCPDEEGCQQECLALLDTLPRCLCDEICDVYGDCCHDSPRNVCYEAWPPTPAGDSFSWPDITSARHTDEQCIRTWISNLNNEGVIPSRPEYGGHWLEAGCPSGYKNKEIVSKCDSEQETLIGNLTLNDTETLVHSIPVTGRLGEEWRHYKNIYCAFCRGVKLQDMHPWNLGKIKCTESVFTPPSTVEDVDCEKFAYRFSPSRPAVEAGDAPFQQARICKPDVVEDCPDLLGNVSGSWAAVYCKSYTALIQLDKEWYKNPHCVICNGITLQSDCFNPRAIPGSGDTPLSIPFDFLPLADDAIDSVALDLECPYGFNYSFNAQECIPAGEMSGVYCNKLYPVVQAIAIVSVDEKTALNSWVEIFVSLFEEALHLDNHTAFTNLNLVTYGVEASAPTPNQETPETMWSLSFDVSNTSTTWEQFNNLTGQMTSLKFTLASHAPSVELLSVKLTQSCTEDVSLDRCEEMTFDPDLVTVYVFEGVKYIYPSEDKPLLYRTDTVFDRVEYALQSSSPNVESVHREIVICNATQDLLCYHITLGQSEYLIEDGVMKFNIEGRYLESSEYLLLPNNSAKVCQYAFQDPWFDYSLPQYVLNVVGTSLSSLALLLTFVTYCAFSSLRTVPGLATMHFVVALFTGEILLLVGGSALRDSPGVCTFMAVVSHYIWLACFFWMTALGFDVSRTFSMTTGPRLVEKGGHALTWMCVFSWGAPAFIVIICLPLHFVYSFPSEGAIDFNYGLGGVCWIRPELANLIAFGLPVVASLVVNAALFGKTVIGLRASKKITSFIEKDKSAMKRASDEFFIYLKVSVLMGLTWIWFFIAAFTGETAIYYVAITLNAFHGCFVFMAFVCNRRVWSMWRRKLGGKRSAGTSSRSGTMSTGKSGTSAGAAMTKSSSVVTSESPVSGSPVMPERMGLNGTRL